MQFEEVNYLLPVDAKLRNVFQLKRETIALSDIIAQMEGRAPMSLVFLDGCRNNPLAEELKQSLVAQGRAVEQTRGLARESARGRNTLLSFAAGPGREARDGQGRNSPFTAALLKYIETPGLEIETMLKRVTQDVLTATENQQEPERLSRLTDEFYFKPGEQQQQKDDQTSKLDVPQSFGPDFLHWSIIKDTINPQLIREFIAKYPSSPFRTDAEAKLQALEQTQQTVQGNPEKTAAFLSQNLPAGSDDRYAFTLSQGFRQKISVALRRVGQLTESVDDYVRNGTDNFTLRFAVIKYQKSKGFAQTGYLLRDQVVQLLSSDTELGQAAVQGVANSNVASLFSSTLRTGDAARETFLKMSLSREERLRMARALESMGLTSSQCPSAFIETADPEVAFTDAIKRFQQGRGYEVTGYPTAEQVRYLVSLGDKPSSCEVAQQSQTEEASLTLGGLDSKQLIARAKIALNDTSQGEGWRELLKDFQRRNGLDPTGQLAEPTILRLLDQFPTVPPPNWVPDDRYKDWAYWQQREGERRCYIWTFAYQVRGRYGLTEAPDLTLSRVPTWPDQHLSATLGKTDWFDTAQPTRIVIDGRSYELTTREGYFWPRVTGNNEYSDEVTIALSRATGPATIIGTSRFGGELAMTFSTSGFAAAFRRMDDLCAKNTLSEWVR
jgi:hypothetical protein